MNRDNPQPSPKVERQGMQFRDLMSVGLYENYKPKIKSVPTEMWSNRGIINACHGVYEESY